MKHESLFEFLGLAAALLIGVALSKVVVAGAGAAQGVPEMGAKAVWLVEHAEPVSWAAVVFVTLTAMAFPMVLKVTKFGSGSSVLATVGVQAWMAGFVCCAGYVLGLGVGLAGT